VWCTGPPFCLLPAAHPRVPAHAHDKHVILPASLTHPPPQTLTHKSHTHPSPLGSVKDMGRVAAQVVRAPEEFIGELAVEAVQRHCMLPLPAAASALAPSCSACCLLPPRGLLLQRCPPAPHLSPPPLQARRYRWLAMR
jgi:hypothetical protein